MTVAASINRAVEIDTLMDFGYWNKYQAENVWMREVAPVRDKHQRSIALFNAIDRRRRELGEEPFAEYLAARAE